MSTYVVRHGPGWKFKRAVPDDIRPALGGKKSWIKTLGSIGYQEAVQVARALATECEKQTRQIRSLSDQDRALLVRFGGLEGLKVQTGRGAKAHANMAALASNIDAIDLKALARDINASGHTSQPVTPGDVAQALIRAKGHSDLVGRHVNHMGNVVQQVEGGPSLYGLIDTWKAVAQPRKESTAEAKRLHLQRFIDIVGQMAPRDVTRAHVMRFRDELEKRTDISRDTAEKHLHALHRLFNVALSEGLVDFNPAHGIKVRKIKGKYVDEAGEKGFQPAQVRTIFKAMHREHTDLQWVVRLMAYHGARGGEICQLRTEDVTKLFGIPVLRIHDEYGSVKNPHSVRDVPIHPKCRGIIDYAKAAKSEWLFTSFPDWRGRAGKFQRWGGAFLRKKAKITDPGLTMHSLRHTWRTLAREVGMTDAMACSIGGWKMGTGEHAKYGGGPSLKERAKWIAKIDPLA